MRVLLILGLCLSAAWSFAAPVPASAADKKKQTPERISKENLLNNDKLMRFTNTNPCWLDRYKYFCCPVRKIVRRRFAEGKWTDYCYNERDELIGLRRGDHRSALKRSDFSTVGGCSRCGNTQLKQRSWKHNTKPRVITPQKRKRR